MERSPQAPKQAPQSETQAQEGLSMLSHEGEQTTQLQAALNNSSSVNQLRSLQAVANASPQVQQLKAQQSAANPLPVQRQENKTGMPDQLKSGIEGLSGMAMDDVKVHYNSSQPAQMQAHAYAQGSDIHIAPGQEKHLAHEAWHVVQQKQGRVKPTLQLKGIAINDDSALEKEADVMGDKAMQLKSDGKGSETASLVGFGSPESQPRQLRLADDLKSGAVDRVIAGERHDELDSKLEKTVWENMNVGLAFESEKIPGTGTAPDAGILRFAHTVTMFTDYAQPFWDAVKEGQNMRNYVGLSLADHAEMTRRAIDELEEVGCESIQEARFRQAAATLLHGIPADVEALMAIGMALRKPLAVKKSKELDDLKSAMYGIHREGSFADVSTTSADLQVARSQNMLQSMNASKAKKVIYKVGEEHVNDMDQMVKRNPNVAVLHRTQYLAEFKDFRENGFPIVAGHAADHIGNADL